MTEKEVTEEQIDKFLDGFKYHCKNNLREKNKDRIRLFHHLLSVLSDDEVAGRLELDVCDLCDLYRQIFKETIYDGDSSE